MKTLVEEVKSELIVEQPAVPRQIFEISTKTGPIRRDFRVWARDKEDADRIHEVFVGWLNGKNNQKFVKIGTARPYVFDIEEEIKLPYPRFLL